MKKLLTILVLCAVFICCAIGFAACDGNATVGQDAQILSIYNTYVAYAEENGETPLTYEEWLASIKGENGKDGKNGINGIDGKDGVGIVKIEKTSTDGLIDTYTITYSNGETATFTIKNGKNGENGGKGDDGITPQLRINTDTNEWEVSYDKGATWTSLNIKATGEKGGDGNNGNDGKDGKSAYEIFLKYYPYYQGTEEQWLIRLVNGELKICTITFKSEVADDIVKYVLKGYAFTDIPAVPEKEGQTSAVWDITDFSNITDDLTVNAVYDMRKYLTFHNEYTDDEDIVKVVNYGEELTEIPEITQKAGNTATWSINAFSVIEQDLFVQAVYETQGLQYVAINQQTEYRVSKGEMTATELFIPAEYNGKPVTVIDENAFNSSNITKAYLPDSLNEIRKSAFEGCYSLKYITIPENITSIGETAFCYCHALTSITIGNIVTSIGGGAFAGCSGLTSINIPDSVTKINLQVFYGCSSLTSIIIPDSVTSIGTCAFEGCSSLTSVAIGSGVTEIGYQAFEGCSSLTSITIGGSVKRIEAETFYGCSNLTNLTIPDSVTNIGGDAFLNCSGLTSITIGNRVTSIGSSAFSGCQKLETVYYKGNESEYEKITVSDGNSVFTDAMVYYYSETEPTESNKFWHYDTDGITPVIWEK